MKFLPFLIGVLFGVIMIPYVFKWKAGNGKDYIFAIYSKSDQKNAVVFDGCIKAWTDSNGTVYAMVDKCPADTLRGANNDTVPSAGWIDARVSWVMISDGLANIAILDTSGRWSIKGDCGKLLTIMYKEHLRMQKETDSLRERLNYFLRI